MAVKIAINGFGRIGRAVLRSIFNQELDLEIAAINDLASADNLAYLLKHDSVYGPFKEKVDAEILSEANLENLPWKEMGIDVVLECTGVFRTKEDAQKHLKAGAKSVIISANAKDEETNHFILGVNENKFDAEKDRISAMGSCTTNCAAPVIYHLNKEFGLLKAHLLTVHAVTANQNLVDGHHKDLRRGRSALVNSVPTTTGAAKAVTRVLPDLSGRISGSAIRVPVICGSVLEVVASLKKEASADEINESFAKAAKGRLKGTLDVSKEALVSSDIIGTIAGAIIDLASTEVLDLPEVKDENLVKVIAWYDNEYAYSYRLAKFAEFVGQKIRNGTTFF